MKYYNLKIAGLTRDLPIIKISDDLSIASFVVLGDCELITATAKELIKKIPDVDYFVTAEAKGIPLVHELCRLRKMPYYIVVRKSIKSYMNGAITIDVNSITTQSKQILCLDGKDAELIKNKKIALIDDVISTGESLNALEKLVIKSGAEIICKAAILAEGDAALRKDIIYLEELPLFSTDK